MKQKLSFKEYIYVASMLFGMFFGAGNLIFPVYMGQVAGRNMWAAVLGFLITGVGLPLLGVAALGISRSNGLFDLSHKVGRPYAFFFTCALYLTIGPFFAIPRCATTSFTVGLEQILPHDDKSWLYLLLFSLLFFAVTLVLSLRPGKILTYVGKVLTSCSPPPASARWSLRGLMPHSPSSPAFWRAITPWTPWQALPSVSW